MSTIQIHSNQTWRFQIYHKSFFCSASFYENSVHTNKLREIVFFIRVMYIYIYSYVLYIHTYVFVLEILTDLHFSDWPHLTDQPKEDLYVKISLAVQPKQECKANVIWRTSFVLEWSTKKKVYTFGQEEPLPV